MSDGIINAIAKLTSELTPSRLLALLSLLFTAAVLIIFAERSTQTLRLSRLERAVATLEKLQNIEKKGFEKNSQFAQAHQRMTQELITVIDKEPLRFDFSIPSYKPPEWHQIQKFFAGAAPWLLLLLFSFFGRGKRSSGDKVTIIGFLFMGSFFGLIGVFIPTIAWPWVNLVLYPALHFLLVIALLLAWAMTLIKRHKPSGAKREK